MIKNQLHLINIAKQFKGNYNDTYFDNIIASCKQNQEIDRYLILQLIKIWISNNQFIGYEFKKWFQQLNIRQSKQPIELLKQGNVQECIQQFEQKLPKNTLETIKRYNFFPLQDSQQQEEQFKIFKQNTKYFEDEILNKINLILSGNLEIILNETQKDWKSFVMLYLQFVNYKITPLQLTQLLEQYQYIQDYDGTLNELFAQIVYQPKEQQIVESVIKYDKFLAYFIYIYFQSKIQDKLRSYYEIQFSKQLILQEIISDIPKQLENENELHFYLKEIQEISNQFENQDNITIKIKETILQTIIELIQNSINFNQLLNFINQIETFIFLDNQVIIIISTTLLEQLFNKNQQLQNTDNALNILINKYQSFDEVLLKIEQFIQTNLENQQFNTLFQDLLQGFNFQQNNSYFRSQILTLSFKFGLRLNEQNFNLQLENPIQVINLLSPIFVQNILNMDDSFRLKMKIIISNILEQYIQYNNTQQNQQNSQKKIDVIKLLIKKL